MEASMKTTKAERDRLLAVKRYEKGERISAIARSLRRSRQWVYKWIERSKNSDETAEWQRRQSTRPHDHAHKLSDEIVNAVKLVRLDLYNQGLFCGAQAIEWELMDLGIEPLPSLRSINRILSREELTHRRTGRYEPKGKKYPTLAADHVNQVHQSDFVGPCYLSGPVRFYSLNSVDLATGRCAVSPVLSK